MKYSACFRFCTAVLAAIGLSSCAGVPGEYGYGGASDGETYYSDYDSYDGPAYSAYRSAPAYYGSVGTYYGSGYGRPYYGGPRYYRGAYRGYHHDNHHDGDDHDSRHYSSSSRNSQRKSSSRPNNPDNDIRLVKVRDSTRGSVPEGYHDKEYFQRRGISLSKNSYVTREGEKRGYTGSSRSSSSQQSSSNSSSRSSSSRGDSNSSRGNSSNSSNSSSRGNSGGSNSKSDSKSGSGRGR